jgi:CheY-like chemotaxis protein
MTATGTDSSGTAQPATVLVVDDEFDIREAVRDVLEGEGYRVITAVNGQEALDLLATLRPCVVLLDLMMPVMNGWQVLDALRKRRGLDGLAVVLVTASDSRPSGVAGLIRKPFDIDRLLSAIERYCPR